MKYKNKYEQNIDDNYLINLLKNRNIYKEGDEEWFFNPTQDNELDCELLDNMEEGYQLLMKHLKGDRKILIVIDPDVDGFTSAALIYNYLKENFACECDYHIPDGKEHGLRSIMQLFSGERRWDLIICPDSASNDYTEHKLLKEMGYDILVLDHHEATKYSEDAVVINNQLSEKYSNKELSGVGVVYKFLEYIERKQDWLQYSKHYLDLVAVGEISDMMLMHTPENRFICDYGLSHFNNIGLIELIRYRKYSLYSKRTEEKLTVEEINENPLTQIQVAFYIAPLINSLIRIGNEYDKERLFLALTDGNKQVNSTRHGEDGLTESIAVQNARKCGSTKQKQDTIKKNAGEELSVQVLNHCLDENKIIILNADELNAPNTMTGLCAAGVCSQYKKPVLLGRLSPDGKYLKGSGRNVSGTEFTDFRQFLIDSGLVEFAQG